MRPQKPISKRAQDVLKKLLNESKTKSQYRRVLCVMLRAALELSAQKIADVVGLNRGTVEQIVARYLKDGAKTLESVGSGGRRHAYLTLEEERLFVKRFVPKASEGGIVVVNEIINEFEDLIGHEVAESTVYRLLARHGWRKIAPRAKHPKADRLKQAEFKKKSPSEN